MIPAGSPLFSPRDPAFVADPYPFYAALRQGDPVHRGPMGVWVLSRYADVEAALADTRLANGPARHSVIHARNRERSVAADVAGNILPFLDGPRHAAMRRLITRAFADQLKQRPPKVEAIAERLLASHLAAGELELLGDFARPLSIAAICDVLGLPELDSTLLSGWSSWFMCLFHPIPSQETLDQIEKALSGFRRYLAEAIAARAQAPGDDLISRLLRAEKGRDGISRTELIDSCMLLFADGVENVDSAISNAIAALLTHPDQLELLRARPELLGSAVEECLRFESPTQYFGRVALEDLCIRDQEIPQHAVVLLVLASANRDASRFAAPDRLDITRRDNPHLAFGKGRHFCVGARLVRQEMEGALAAIVRRLPDLALREEALDWQARTGHRWLAALPVTFAPN